MSKPTKESWELIRTHAESDLVTFIRLVAPHRVLGAIHEDLCRWMTREDGKDHQLVLLPRDHQKSAMIAFWAAWWVTKNPETTILYVSATADLAEKQLKFIKDIFTSDIYQYYWPEMVMREENKRERWTVDEISVDHPKRRDEIVRDPTIKAVGLTSNVTGLHCNVAILDDVVVPGNAYTVVGREQVRALYSQLSSIETTGAQEKVVGTRYHPKDLYADLMEMEEIYWDENGEEHCSTVYEIFEKEVEDSTSRDGSGNYLWPRTRRKDGKYFGFDARELARKKAKYLDVVQFYAQYYNDPSDPENAPIDRSRFQYYNSDILSCISGAWYMGSELLNIYAAIDFAFSTNMKADYTALVVIGIDSENRYYILDIDRFKTDKISVMFDHVRTVYSKWKFKKLRAEVTAAQIAVVNQLKDYMRQTGFIFTIDEHRPTRDKEERIASILEPRYAQQLIWHYRGGNCSVLEEELVAQHPPHDDIKDCLASVVEIAVAPRKNNMWRKKENVIYSSRFGGVATYG